MSRTAVSLSRPAYVSLVLASTEDTTATAPLRVESFHVDYLEELGQNLPS
ncbi:MAG: hypothetical protein HXS41_15830 [Theionarchaea archaeon]|nr:hypothetical protein [Theionarchaea archaeon]